jgi:hypothetical protein
MLVPKSHVELQPVSLRPVEYYFDPLTQARLRYEVLGSCTSGPQAGPRSADRLGNLR